MSAGSCSARRWAAGNELADRFEGDSLRLADLEVRQRMAGRWVMATIQMSFSIMPAAVYWFGGWRSRAGTRSRSRRSSRSRRCRRACSSRSAPARRRPRRADLARALRPDLRVPRPAGRHRGEAGRASPARRPATSSSTTSGSATATRLDARGRHRSRSPAGTTTALVGETGSGKTTLGYLAARLYDVDRGTRLDRRRRHPRPAASRR